MASEVSAWRERATRLIAATFTIVVTMSSIGCHGDGGVSLAPTVPLAYTRFVHAVADTGATDWRFIDQLENSPVAFGLAFRGLTPYQATAPGDRRLRVFPTSTNIDVTSRFLIDTILHLENDTYYTIVHVGHAGAAQLPAHHIFVLKDEKPEAATRQIAVRVVHLGSGLGPIDVFADTLGGASPLPASPMFVGLPFGSRSSYQLRDTSRLVLRVTGSGQTIPIVASAIAPAGDAGDAARNLTTIGGSRMGRSVISAFLFPRSVAGSSAQPFTTPGLVFQVDKHPR